MAGGAALGLVLAGCRGPGSPPSAPPGTGTAAKVYRLRGTVVASYPASNQVAVDGEAIPGFMEAMTMPYKVKGAGIASDLHPGDRLTADVIVSSTGETLLDHIVVTAQGRPDYRPARVYHVPSPGDEVPDFRLVNQQGSVIRLGQFRGKALLVTFIYTRCPLPDYCPRISRNFAEIHRRLAADPALGGRVQLLSVSFDEKNDTPAVLRSYAAGYLGSDRPAAFRDWQFAVPGRGEEGAKAELERMAEFFDVGLSRERDGSITHTLSTTLIGPDGKVRRFYPGNEWTVDEVLADVRAAAGGGP
jgi:protein SCO1/2